jgi:hypothetical protein
MAARDPRIDPQPGDEVRGDDMVIRRVIRRKVDMLWCETWKRCYRMRLDTWQKWCEQSGARAAAVVKQQRVQKKGRDGLVVRRASRPVQFEWARFLS